MNELRGTGIALVTPFDKTGRVDLQALDSVVEHVIKGGVEYLVILGTTGESVTLSSAEKELVIQQIIKSNNGRLPLVLGVGGNNTAAVLNTLEATDLAPFTAILSVSPAYNKPTQEGIYQHFKVIAEHSSKPILLYNVPGRTASNVEPETVLRLANDFENIIGIKEAKGDMVQALRLLKDRPKNFLVISGDDMVTLPMVLAGGDGVISVIGQGLPKDFSEMVRLGLKGAAEKAFALHYQMMPSIDLIFEEGNPAGIKAMLALKGVCEAHVRLPLVKASPDLHARLDHFLKRY